MSLIERLPRGIDGEGLKASEQPTEHCVFSRRRQHATQPIPEGRSSFHPERVVDGYTDEVVCHPRIAMERDIQS